LVLFDIRLTHPYSSITQAGPIYVLVYIDDIIIVGSSQEVVTALLHDLENKDLSESDYFLSIYAKS